MHAHVTNGTIDQLGTPPATAFAQGRWWDLRTLEPAALAATGWVDATETARPADTGTTTHDSSWAIVGGKAVQSWTARPKTTAELAADGAATNGATIRQQAETALDTNRTYLAITAPTNAQIAAQVKALARQNNGVIRLVLQKLDATD
jgi:hypothetical protein